MTDAGRSEDYIRGRGETPTPPLPLLALNGHHVTGGSDGTRIYADSNNVDNPLRTAETDCSS